MKTRKCNQCKKVFTPKSIANIYCSKNCFDANAIKEKKIAGSGYNLPNSTIGSINELKVSIILLELGYYVFRTLSSNSPFDIYAYKEDKTPLQIEIRTAAKYKPNGELHFARHDRDRCNVYAAVHRTEIRFYDKNKNEVDLNEI